MTVPQAPSPHTLHFHAPADAIVRKGETPKVITWGAKSRMIVKGFTPEGFIVDEFNTVGEEVRVEVYFAEAAVATDPLTPRTTPVSTDPSNALVVTWRAEEWSNFQYKAWIFRLRIRVENRTDQPIRLMNVTFQGPPTAETTPEIYAETERIKCELGTSPSPVPPHDAIEMWYVGEFRFDPDLGEPEYEIRVKASNGGHEYGFRRIGNPKVSIPIQRQEPESQPHSRDPTSEIAKLVEQHFSDVPLTRLEQQGLREFLFYMGSDVTAQPRLVVAQATVDAQGQPLTFQMSLNPLGAYTIRSDGTVPTLRDTIKKRLEEDVIPIVRSWPREFWGAPLYGGQKPPTSE